MHIFKYKVKLIDMKKIISTLFFAIILLISNAFGQIQDPVTWKVSANKIDDSKYEIIFDATIQMGWHLYSSENPEGGPIPTTFIFAENNAFSLLHSFLLRIVLFL